MSPQYRPERGRRAGLARLAVLVSVPVLSACGASSVPQASVSTTSAAPPASTSASPLASASTTVPAAGQPGNGTAVASAGDCAVLASGGVDCWGDNSYDQLGNGTTTQSSTAAVAVVGLGGSGLLSGVASLVAGDNSHCVVLHSGGVDCWGNGAQGQLGNGQANENDSDVPVAVAGVGGTGTLSGVTSLASGGNDYCAILTSGGTDCWGNDAEGELGNATTGASNVPVAVHGPGGTGSLSAVKQVTGSGGSGYDNSFCALLTSGGVDCWGDNTAEDLGIKSTQDSHVPVAVLGLGGQGTLSGATSLAYGYQGYCAVVTSGGVDCWGLNTVGQLGSGVVCPRSPDGPPACPTQDTAVAIVGLGKAGTQVASVVSDLGSSFCAILVSGGVDCWGKGQNGELGTGQTNGFSSEVPTAVLGVGGTGTLSGVANMDSNDDGYCAALTSGGVDCWGENITGDLGDGTMTGPRQCLDFTPCAPEPAAVAGVGGTGILSGVKSVVPDVSGSYGNCVVLTSGGMDCWGASLGGTSDVPVALPLPA
jgi:alpha-tubulin suppressor-like RCC1 family protein